METRSRTPNMSASEHVARVADEADEADEDRRSPFHEGERAVQRRAGVRARAEQMGSKMLRPFMPDQHREFYATLPFVLVGSLDQQGRPWASLLAGAPGFVHAPDPHTLSIGARPRADDPLAAALTPGSALGLLGIQLETRRRNRVNGRVTQVSPDGFALRVDQSFGNCPKYINVRTPIPVAAHRQLPATREGSVLSAAALVCITDSDTCFIASASSPRASLSSEATDRREGVDVSHRGGHPGFVRHCAESGHSVLTMPDFAGNNAFNTLGNLARYPRAGYLFPNFATGDLLLLTGQTEIIWDGPELARFRGAERLLRLHVEAGLLLARTLPFRWSPPEPGLMLDQTGTWQEALDDAERP